VPLLEELASPSSSAYAIATALLTISILLSGMAIGIGKALGNRKLEGIGKEELTQAIISAAIFGAIVVIAATTEAAAASLVPDFSAQSLCPSLGHASDSPAFYAQCNYVSLLSDSEALLSSAMKSQNILGFLSKLGLELGAVSAQPFFGLQYAAESLNSLLSNLALLISMLSLQASFLGFAIATAFPIFLPAGLILRMFFATRKLGAAAMALAVAFYIIYPLVFLAAIPALSGDSSLVVSARQEFDQFNSKYSSVPMMDLQKENVVVQKINELSQQDLVGEASQLVRSLSRAISALAMLALVLPLLGLATALAGASALYASLGTEITLGKFEII
jgi:hypothetical protein